MKIPSKTISLLATAALFTFSSLSAVETDPVGYVSTDIVSGYNPIGVTFIKPAVFSGSVTSTTTNSITLSSSPVLGSGTYYLEVITSSADVVGERIDIASAAGNVLTLDSAAAHNTTNDASLIAANSTIQIREHFTIGDFDSLIASEVNSDDSFASAGSDLILLYIDGEGFKTHLNYLDEWYENFGDFNVATDKVIAPGNGFFFFRNPGAGTPSEFTVVFSGTVRMNNYIQKLTAGYQFVANGYPISASPNDFSYSDVLEASNNFDAAESDLILTWNGSLKTHLLYDDGAGSKNWYENFGNFNTVDDNTILTASNAMFIFIKDTGHVLEIVRPF
jgi:hypothetical protein